MEFSWGGELMDTVFSLMGKYGRWLNNGGRKTCFVLWSICALYWSIRDVYLHLYSQAFFCLISLIMHAHGYWNWKRKGIGEK